MASKNNLCIIIVLPKNKIGAEGEQFVTEGAAFVCRSFRFSAD